MPLITLLCLCEAQNVSGTITPIKTTQVHYTWNIYQIRNFLSYDLHLL